MAGKIKIPSLDLKSADELTREILDKLREKIPELSDDPTSFQYILAEAIAQVIDEFYYYLNQSVKNSVLYWIKILGMERKTARRAIGFVRVYPVQKNPPFVIPSGTLFATENDILFRATEDVQVPANTSYVDVPVEAVKEGAEGNVPAHSIVEVRSSIAYIHRVDNPEPMQGGQDDEEIDELIERANEFFLAKNTAVTKQDFESLALTLPFVEKARAIVTNPRHLVRLYLLTKSGDTFQPLNSQQKQDVIAFFEDKKMITVELQVEDPTLVQVDIEVNVWRRQGYSFSEVQTNTTNNIKKYFESLEIGQDVTITALNRVLSLTQGVDTFEIITPASNIEIRETEFAVLRNLQVNVF